MRPIVASHPAAPTLAHMSLERPSSRGALLGSLAAGLALSTNAQSAMADTPRSSPWSFSTFLDAIEQDLVDDRDGNRHEALILNGESTELVKKLTKKGITFAVQAPQDQGVAQGLLGVLPSLL